MYQTILLPTDGSDGAAAAIEAGIELAARYQATVHALYVMDERYVVADYDLIVEEAERRAERALDTVGDHAAAAGIAVEKHLRKGIPHEEIIAAIDAYDADLVVMGTHGRSGLSRLVHLGSVTERVLRAAPVPVVTIPLRDR